MSSILAPALLLASALTSSAAIVWTGAADSNFYNTDNWDFSGSSVTAANFNASASIADNIVISNASSVSLGGLLTVANGFNLTLNSSSLTSTATNGFNGGADFGATVNVSLNGISSLNVQFISKGVNTYVSSGSTLSVRGTDKPINSDTGTTNVYLSPGASLNFANASVINNHSGYHRNLIFNSATGNTLSGSPADFNPSTGATITAIPEPSFTLLGALGLLAFARRRR